LVHGEGGDVGFAEPLDEVFVLGGLDEGDEGAARFHGVDLVGAHCGVVLGIRSFRTMSAWRASLAGTILAPAVVYLSLLTLAWTPAPSSNQHLKSSLHETIHAFRSESDSLLLGIDLFGDTDFQAFNVLTEHEATSEETTTPA
jgi:hypothetical protein